VSVRFFSTSSIKSGVKGSDFWDGSAVVQTSAYESISTIVLSTSPGSVTFSSIPSTYKHLQIRAFARTTSNTLITFQVNGDSGNNYSIHNMQGNGSSVVGGATASYNFGGFSQLPSASNVFSAGVIDILDYTDTSKFTTFRTLSGWDDNSAGRIESRSSQWRSTSTITSIVLTTDAGTPFQPNSHFALYGIKG
jgi:hypothetical protein